MYDSMWQLCTDAMATLTVYEEVCLQLHVLLSDALSLRSDYIFALPTETMRAEASDCHARCQFCHLWKRSM